LGGREDLDWKDVPDVWLSRCSGDGYQRYIDKDGDRRYVDNNIKINDMPYRPCAKCKAYPTKEGHDACLGTLPFVWNACCGHGDPKKAYIQWYKNRLPRFNGYLAIVTQKILKLIRCVWYSWPGRALPPR
jgi:hypothetical protein